MNDEQWAAFILGYEAGIRSGYEAGRQAVIDEHKAAGAALAPMLRDARREIDARAARARSGTAA